MKKKADKNNSKKDAIVELKDEFKRHASALMEHMTKEVKTIAEGHSALSSKLNNIDVLRMGPSHKGTPYEIKII